MSLDALAYITTRSPLKVSIVFALGIILPSVFLGYLGVRSYRYENRLMHKEAEERFAVTANLIESKVAESLSGIISDLKKVATQPPFQGLDYGQLVAYLLSKPHV